MLILLLGDCHGRLDLVHQACAAAQATYGIEAAIQVGDFGFFSKIIHRFLHEGPRRFPVPLHVIDGNHEDHEWLHACRHDGSLDTWSAANLHLHARGTVEEVGEIRIGFVGGALHADRRQEWAGQWQRTTSGAGQSGRHRIPHDPVWSNWVSGADVDRAVAAYTATPPDLLVTHSCPARIGVGMVGAPSLADDVEHFVRRAGFSSGPSHDCGEGGLTDLWNRLPRRPALWVFGHFHRVHQRRVGDTIFTCVGCSDGSDGAERPAFHLLDTTHLRIVGR